MCVCGRRLQCHRWIGLSWQRGQSPVGRFASAVFFLSSISDHFHLYHLYECNALCVKNVERLITVWWSKAWDGVFTLYLVKWSILDVQFKTIESCSSGASTSVVDILFCICNSCENLCRSSERFRAEEGFLHLSHQWERKSSQHNIRLWISALLWWRERATRSGTFSSLSCLWRNRRWKPTFWGRNSFLYFLLRPLFKLSVYVKDWAADCSVDLLQRLKDCTLKKKGQRRVRFLLSLHVQTRQVTNTFTLSVFSPLTVTCFWHVKGYCRSLSNSLCHKLSSPLTEKPFGHPDAVSSEVCVCSSTQCVSLIASRPWWVAVLTSWKHCGYYWYSSWAKTGGEIPDEKKQSLADSHWKKCQEGSISRMLLWNHYSEILFKKSLEALCILQF